MLEMIAAPNTSIGFHGPVSGTTASMVPTATEVTPNSVEVYGSSLSLKVKGNNFIPTSKVLWENDLGIDLQTSYISSTELTAILPNSLYLNSNSAGLYDITVFNPGPGGGSSPPLTFTIKNPVPVLNSNGVSPNNSEGNPTTISITVTGNNFVSGSRVRFNGSDSNITTTFISTTSLKAEILRSKLTPGVIQITVYNPTPGGGTSAAVPYNLYTPTPTLTKFPTAYKSNTPYSSYRSPTPQRTRTRTATITTTGTIIITPSATVQFTPDLTRSTTPDLTTTSQTTPEPGSATPTLAPGEPTYTPEPPSPEDGSGSPSIFLWRLWSILRILGGTLLGTGLISIPAFFVLKHKTGNKNPQ